MPIKRKNASSDSEPHKRVKSNSGVDPSIRNTTRNARQDVTSTAGVEVTVRPEDTSRMQRPGKAATKLKGVAKGKGEDIMSAPVKPAPQPSTRREHIRKLAPPRPFPTAPSSVSASGPKSAHKEGKNLICITRHTPLAAYLSRCKKLLVEDGYHVLHLHAMGAAIPHLLSLTVSLPSILPFARDDIQLEVRTGTIEVMDEVMPEDEDEDISLRARGKGGVSVIIRLRTGEDTVAVDKRRLQPVEKSHGNGKGKKKAIIIVQEQEQEDDEMIQDEENLSSTKP